MWLGDQESDAVTVKLTTQLMEQQIDFDHIDQDSLASVCTLEGGGLKNLSGQVYRAVIIPTSTVIEKKVLERLRAFAAAGGKVVFVGRTPSMVVDRTFLNPDGCSGPELRHARVCAGNHPAQLSRRCPNRTSSSTPPAPPIKYIHRALKDGDRLFLLQRVRPGAIAHGHIGRQRAGSGLGCDDRDDSSGGWRRKGGRQRLSATDVWALRVNIHCHRTNRLKKPLQSLHAQRGHH